MPATKEGRVTKSKRAQRSSGSPARRVSSVAKSLPLVERTNALAIGDFISQYVPSRDVMRLQGKEADRAESTADKDSRERENNIQLDVYSTATLSGEDLEACLDLVELTSREDYSASSAGWSRSKKRKEMKLPEMKYLILRNTTEKADLSGQRQCEPPGDNELENEEDTRPKILGFLSCMVTYEDGREVMYCYEIHLSHEARGRGLGGMLMMQMEEIGRRIGLEKCMLTVFRSNTRAREFYEKGGYHVDEYSPQPRRLRNGTIKEADYLILSKRFLP
ncbi:Acyl-CoA N-acyltransferase [Penicillium ucsense]|uniref:N-alpha-acetyltransferase 40 n=1 Tax=Penicillium ucsense TaxID=2839758 RepID=A0A8J8W3R5_9EURO|nr:Acyl-CoA N-acyltransferase [Penicillium ucsense]KAF7735721.1 Acyl-CoA N-acyltransferase [Penicillium ucsense]